MITVLVHREGQTRQVDAVDLAWLAPGASEKLWVDIELPDDGAKDLLQQTFKLHELSLEDALSEIHHPKIELFDHYLYLILHGILPAAADDKSEIRIGQTLPYSGPVSGFGIIGRSQEAYFAKVNAEGGINGRKLTWVSYDDGYNPAKTVEMARKLVEQDEVLFIFNVLGTPPNSSIHKYMNQN